MKSTLLLSRLKKAILLFAVIQFVHIHATEAQTYDTGAPAYWELLPEFYRDGDYIYAEFNLKFEDRLFEGGDGIRDIAKAVWVNWGGQIIYGVEMHNYRSDHLPLEGDGDYSENFFVDERFGNQGFSEYYYKPTEASIQKILSNTSVYGGRHDVVRLTLKIDIRELGNTYGEGDSGSLSINGYYYDATSSGWSTDDAGLHISETYTIEENASHSDEIDFSIVPFDNSGGIQISFNLEKREGELEYDHVAAAQLWYKVDGNWHHLANVRHGSDLFDDAYNPLNSPNQTINFNGEDGDSYIVELIDQATVFERNGKYYTDDGLTSYSGGDAVITVYHYPDKADFGKEIEYSLEGYYYIRSPSGGVQVDLLDEGIRHWTSIYYDGLSFIPDISAPSVTKAPGQVGIQVSWQEPTASFGESSRHRVYIYKDANLVKTFNAHDGHGNRWIDTDIQEDQTYDYQVQVGYYRYLNGNLTGNISSSTSYAYSDEEDNTGDDEIAFAVDPYPDLGFVDIRIRVEKHEDELAYDHLQCIDIAIDNLTKGENYHIGRIGHASLACDVLEGSWSTENINGNHGDSYKVQYSTASNEAQPVDPIQYVESGNAFYYFRYYYGSDKFRDQLRFYVNGKYYARDEFGKAETVNLNWWNHQRTIRPSDYWDIPDINTPNVQPLLAGCGIEVSWEQPTANFGESGNHRIVIFRNDQQVASLDAYAAHNDRWIDTDVEAGKSYSYQVAVAYDREYNGTLIGDRSLASTYTYPILEAPAGIGTTQANCDGSIEVSWVYGSNPDNFILQRKDNTSAFQTIADNIDGALRDFTDTDIIEGKQYSYRIAAQGGECNFVGEFSPVQTHSRDTLDLSKTIALNDLETSKGYFGDRTELFWELTGENEEYVNRFRIYARVLGTDVAPTLVESPERDDRNWFHTRGDANVIYEYFVTAERVIETECGFETTRSFDIGAVEGLTDLPAQLPDSGVAYAIGLRSPTAVVNGNITYAGGIAVPDVKVVVEPEDQSPSKSLYFNGDSRVVIPSSKYLQVDTALTISLWVKPQNLNQSSVILYKEGMYTLEYSAGQDQAFFVVYDSLGTAQPLYVPSDDLVENNWVNLTCTYSAASGVMKLYINGRNSGDGLTIPEGKRMIHQDDSDLILGKWRDENYNYQGHLDEIRIYNRALSEQEVKREYGRVTATDTRGLVAYWKVYEGYGNYIFDAAHLGSFYFKHDGVLEGVNWSDDLPSTSQLGFAGYSNASGNYSIEGIPYFGNGENFKVTPTVTLGGVVHEFDPVAQSIYLGEGNLVENGINFKDVSSFEFSGNVTYDFENEVGGGVKSVGSSGAQVYLDGTTLLKDINDNPILTDTDGSFNVTIPIGKHYLEFRKSGHTFSDGGRWPAEGRYDFQADVMDVQIWDQTSHRLVGTVSGGTRASSTPVFSSEQFNNIGEAYFEITSMDTQIRRTVQSDSLDGTFDVSLPPLEYTISSIRWKLDDQIIVPSSEIKPVDLGATEAYSGQYEVDSTLVPDVEQTYPTFEAQEIIQNFRIDSLTGTDIYYSWNLNSSDMESFTLSWVNTLDEVATIGTGLDNSGFDPGEVTGSIPYVGDHPYNPNNELPKALILEYTSLSGARYEVGVEMGIVNPQLLLRYDTIGYTYRYDTIRYDLRKDFIYRVDPELKVTTAGDTLFSGESAFTFLGEQEVAIDISQLPYPSFFTGNPYSLEIRAVEEYINKDNGRAYAIPVTDGSVTINNGIGTSYTTSESGEVQLAEGSQLTLDEEGLAVYHFFADEPSTTQIQSVGQEHNSFTRSINVTLSTDNFSTSWPQDPVNDPQLAYVMGAVKIPNASFVTQGPETVELILRDPPGSDSYAYRAAGSKYTATEEFIGTGFGSLSGAIKAGFDVKAEGGGSFAAHGAVHGEGNLKLSGGIKGELEGSAGATVERSIETVETITTNEDAIEVGMSDVFVSKSHNLETGLALYVRPIPVDQCGGNCFGDIITMDDNLQFQMGVVQNPYVTSDGLPTYSVYTQNHIVNVLIPDLVSLRNAFFTREGSNYTSYLSADDPMYGSNNDDPEWGASATTTNFIRTELADLDGPSYWFDNQGDNTRTDSVRWINQQIRLWKEALATNEIEKWAALNSTGGVENVSLASGVTLERSVTNTASEVSMISLETTTAIEVGIEAEIEIVVAATVEIDGELGLKTSTTSTRGNETENTIGYTLNDPDENDAFSIDIAPGVGANGPVFKTLGGQSSCPFEDEIVMEYATAEFITRAIQERQDYIVELEKRKSVTTILKQELEQTKEDIENEVKDFQKDLKKYGEAQVAMLEEILNIEKMLADMKVIAEKMAEGALLGVIQKSIEPLSKGVNGFIGGLKKIKIPIPLKGNLEPFKDISEIPDISPSGDQLADVQYIEQLVKERAEEMKQIAEQIIDDANEQIMMLQDKIKKRLLAVNNLTIRVLELQLDLESINAEIAAVNNQVTKYQQLQGELAGASGPIILSNATQQREKPTLKINGADHAQVYNVPADQKANFSLLLGNESETGDAQYYQVQVLEGTNPNGLVMAIDGTTINKPLEFLVPGGSAIQKILTVERGPFEYDYSNVQVLIRSGCQYDRTSNTGLIADTVSFNVKYLPTCSDVEVILPEDNWTGNSSYNNVIPITIGGYDINSTGLENIAVQYKPSSSAEWMLLETFYRDENAPEWTDGAPVLPKSGNVFQYDWEIEGLIDGEYDIRATANCALASTESDIHSGIVDRVNPHPFGSPEPGDGIYAAGDELSIQFNEPINEGLIQPANFSITGVLNGGDIRHNASAYYGGVSDQFMLIEEGIDLTRKSFTVEMYVRRADTGTEVLFSQGGASDRSLQIGFDANNLPYLAVNGNVLTSGQAILGSDWHHLAFVYDHQNADAFVYDNAMSVGIDNSFEPDYQSSGRIFLAKSTFGDERPFNGNIHELRIWNKPLSITEVSLSATKRMDSNQAGLVGNWRMEEANGAVAFDHIRSKHGQMNGEWMVEPGGFAFSFDGTNHLEASSPSFSKTSDFTIEFWIQGTAGNDGVTFISNGRGDELDANTSGWAIGADNANLVVNSNGQEIATDFTILDDKWHHVAVAINRVGNVTVYADAEEVGSISSDLVNGFGGSKLWLGARGWYDGAVEEIDQHFSGSIDEVRVWALAKRADHLAADIQNKLNGDETGLVLYYPFESYQDIGGGILDIGESGHNHATTALATENDLVGTSSLNYTNNTIAIKLPRPLEKVPFNYSSNGDKIILHTTVNPAKIENVQLTVSVDHIQDMNGNRMVSPVSWTAFVDRSTLIWVESEKTFEVQLGEGVQFSAEIYNRGGDVQDFNLGNLPDWLTAVPVSGAVEPLSSQKITFSVSESTNIGNYLQDIVMENSFGFDERLMLNLNVYQNPPADWQVDPADYEYSMSVLNRVRIKGEFSRDENDLVAAFVGSECRGVAPLKYIQSQDNYQAYLSVYSNELTGEKVDYRIWNASEGLVHTFVTPSDEQVTTFSADAFHGTLIAPIVFDAGVNIEKVRDVVTGWQWLSFNLTSPEMNTVAEFMQDFPAVEGDQVKGSEYYDQYDDTNGWLGTITANGGIKNGKMYKFKLQNPAKLKYRGEPVDPASNPVSLKAGWNWVSFLGQNLIPIDEALANVSGLSEGDIIKSQKQFATYGGPGVGWVGSLDVMIPGEGYLYKAAAAGSIIYPKVAAGGSRITEPDFSHFSLEGLEIRPEDYPDNMSLILEADSDYPYLVAYVGEEVRGVAYPQDNPETGRTTYFMTVFGSEDVAMEFRGVSEEGVVSLFAETNVSFAATNFYGTLKNPMLLSGKPLNVRGHADIQLYPNPFQKELTIMLPQGAETVTLITLAGQTMISENVKGMHHVTLDTRQISSGIYLIRIERAKGSQTFKVIKQ